jgi:hypothetical protein
MTPRGVPARDPGRRQVWLYHRLLRLRYYRPRPLMTFILFEGSVIAAVLLSLAEILEWWSVLALPATVAALVKFNDVIAGLARPRYPADPAGPGGTSGPPSPPV